jgi:multiple sugar transport system substrate-binding protein
VADDSVGGKFKWRTAVFPVPGPNAKLPTGGMAAMMFAGTPEKQKAAWQFMKFATGAVGATIMVKGTGYMPPNSLPADDPNMLKPFYATRPNHLTSLKIIALIKDQLQSVVDGSTQPNVALAAMAKDVQALIPK